RTRLSEAANQRALRFAANSSRPADARAITLTPLLRTIDDRTITYDHLRIELDRERACVTFLVQGPAEPVRSPIALGCEFWPLAIARELDDAILHLRFNEEALRTWVFRTEGDAALVASYDAFLSANAEDWLVREIILYLKRTLKRVDV